MGAGKSRQAYLVPWQAVEKMYFEGNLKITLDEIRSYPEMKRAGALYLVAGIIIENERTHKMISPV
jgi:hypothetical protein